MADVGEEFEFQLVEFLLLLQRILTAPFIEFAAFGIAYHAVDQIYGPDEQEDV